MKHAGAALARTQRRLEQLSKTARWGLAEPKSKHLEQAMDSADTRAATHEQVEEVHVRSAAHEQAERRHREAPVVRITQRPASPAEQADAWRRLVAILADAVRDLG